MSRKDRKFPKHIVLKIDGENPPADLWERGSRRCIKCGTQWPAYSIFNPSPCCNANAAVIPEAPSMTWSEAVKRLLFARFERYYEKWNDDVTDEALLFDESIDAFPISEDDLREGLAEIDRLIGETSQTSET